VNCPIIYTLDLITRQFCCGQILLSVIKPQLPSSWQSGGYLETAFKEVIEATLRGTWKINAVTVHVEIRLKLSCPVRRLTRHVRLLAVCPSHAKHRAAAPHCGCKRLFSTVISFSKATGKGNVTRKSVDFFAGSSSERRCHAIHHSVLRICLAQ
jgi:hypothetical protein